MAFERTNPQQQAVRLTGNPMATVSPPSFSAAGAIQSLASSVQSLGDQFHSWGADKMRVESAERAQEMGYAAELQYDAETGTWSAPATPFKGGYRTVAQANSILDARLATMNEMALDAQLDSIALAHRDDPEGYYNAAESAIAGFTSELDPVVAGKIQASVFGKMKARGNAIEQRSYEKNYKLELEGINAAYNDYTEKYFDALVFGDDRVVAENEAKVEAFFHKRVASGQQIIPAGSTPEQEVARLQTSFRIMADIYRGINEDLTTGVADEAQLQALVAELEGLERAAAGIANPGGMEAWGEWNAEKLARALPDPEMRKALAGKVGSIADAYRQTQKEDDVSVLVDLLQKKAGDSKGPIVWGNFIPSRFTDGEVDNALDQIYTAALAANGNAEFADPNVTLQFVEKFSRIPPSLLSRFKNPNGTNAKELEELGNVLNGMQSVMAGNERFADIARSGVLDELNADDRKWWAFYSTRLQMVDPQTALEETQEAAKGGFGDSVANLLEIYNTGKTRDQRIGSLDELINKGTQDMEYAGWFGWMKEDAVPLAFYPQIQDQIKTELEIAGASLAAGPDDITEILTGVGEKVRKQWSIDPYAVGGWSHKSQRLPALEGLDGEPTQDWIKAAGPGIQEIIANEGSAELQSYLSEWNVGNSELIPGETLRFRQAPGRPGLYEVYVHLDKADPAGGRLRPVPVEKADGSRLIIDMAQVGKYAAEHMEDAKRDNLRWTRLLDRGEYTVYTEGVINPFATDTLSDGTAIPAAMNAEQLTSWIYNKLGIGPGKPPVDLSDEDQATLEAILEWNTSGGEMLNRQDRYGAEFLIPQIPTQLLDVTQEKPVVVPSDKEVSVPSKYRSMRLEDPDIGTQLAELWQTEMDDIPNVAVNWTGEFEDDAEFEEALKYASRGITWDNPTGYSSAAQNTFTATGNHVGDVVAAVKTVSQEFGFDAESFLNLALYETIGSLNPNIRGGGTKDGRRGQYLGLIQMGPAEQKKYGYYAGMPVEQAVRASMQFLKDRGYDPKNYATKEEQLNRMYRTVIGGNPNAKLSASDINGTIASHLTKLRSFSAEAQRLMGSNFSAVSPGSVSFVGKNGKPWTPDVKPAVTNLVSRSMAEIGRDKVVINSGFRDPFLNAQVGGATYSQHMHANAVDISTRGMKRAEILQLIQVLSRNGAGGIGVYDNAIHVDIGSVRYWGPSYKAASIPAWAKQTVEMHRKGLFRV